MKICFISLFLMLLCLSSCTKTTDPFKLPPNAAALISGNSSKTWKIARRTNGNVRMNMGPCFLAYRQTFKEDFSFTDNNGETSDCGKTLQGRWKLITTKKGTGFIKISSPGIPELMGIEEDYKFFKILKLNKDTLMLSFEHKQYGSEPRKITDILVREDLDVGDRFFHH